MTLGGTFQAADESVPEVEPTKLRFLLWPSRLLPEHIGAIRSEEEP